MRIAELKQLVKFNRLTRPVLLLVVFVLIYMILKVFVYYPSPNQVSYTNNNFYVFDLNIPANLDFCGEKSPLTITILRKILKKSFLPVPTGKIIHWHFLVKPNVGFHT